VLLTPSLRERFRPWIEWAGKRWWIIVVLLVMPEPVALLGGLTVLSLAYLGLVLSAREGVLADRPSRWLNSRFLLELGTYSHAMYVFSSPITKAVLPHNPTHIVFVDSIVHIVVIGGLSYAMARVSWALWERPWLKLKARFAYH
jgi:peptidoglycan/LPS O-acetylase OafA/YrhL